MCAEGSGCLLSFQNSVLQTGILGQLHLFFPTETWHCGTLKCCSAFSGFHAQWLLGALALKAISAPSGVKLAWIYKSFKAEDWIRSLNKGYVLDETLPRPSRAADGACWCLSKQQRTWKLHSPRICYSNAVKNSPIDGSLVKNEPIIVSFERFRCYISLELEREKKQKTAHQQVSKMKIKWRKQVILMSLSCYKNIFHVQFSAVQHQLLLFHGRASCFLKNMHLFSDGGCSTEPCDAEQDGEGRCRGRQIGRWESNSPAQGQIIWPRCSEWSVFSR